MGTFRLRTGGLTVAIGLVSLVVSGCQWTPPPSVAPGAGSVTITIPVQIADKTVTSAAVDVYSARLKALGYGDFSVAVGDAIVFTLPGDPPPDQAKIRAAFGARGSMVLLPLPSAKGAPAVGAEAPAGIPPLFDPVDKVVGASVVDSNGAPSIQIDLGPIGTKAVAAYSREHIGDYLVIVLDGTVLMSPIVQDSLPDGHVLVSLAPTDKLPLPNDVVAAVIGSGPLPVGWP